MLGFRVLEQNRRIAGTELDVVAELDGKLVVAEVRSRASGAMVDGAASIDSAKRERLQKGVRALAGGGDARILYVSVVSVQGEPVEVEVVDESF